MLIVIVGVVALISLLSAALICTIKLSISITPMGDYALPAEMIDSSRAFPWPKPAK